MFLVECVDVLAHTSIVTWGMVRIHLSQQVTLNVSV